MYNHQKSSSLDSEKINRVDIPKAETATFPTSKSVRISDETFYLGSTQSDSISKGITSGKESPDSTYFSSIISDTSEGAENDNVSVEREPAGFQQHHSMKTFPHPALKVTHPRTQSDSLFVSTGGTGSISPSSPTLHKHRLASENSAPIFKAAELHHNLLNLRLNLNGLYAERHKLQKELESTLLHRENLIAKQRVLKGSEPSEPPNTQHLLELREKLAQESERTSHLLQLAVKAKQDVLDPGSLDDISNLIKKYQDRKKEVVDQRIKSLEEQIEILKQNKKTGKPQIAENLQQDLLKSKTQLCEFLKSEIARNQRLLNGKIDVVQIDDQLKTSDEADRQLRLKVLRFGLDERRKKLQNTKNEADSLASKLDSMKIETFKKKLTAITEMYSTLEFQQKILHNSRNRVKSMREELTKIKLTFHGEREETVDERRQKVDILLTQINRVKSEIQELDSKPVLLKLNLEKSIKSKKAAIENVERDSALIKSRIRRRCKQLKTLQPVGSEANEKLQKLDDLNHRLSAVSKRLEFAENLDRRTQDVLSRQELGVENAKTKFNRVKELYAEEKRAQLLRLSELETEKEEYAQRLMCLNKKLDRLGRQNLLKGTQGAYKWIMASFDIPDYECEDEIDEYVSKRCAFICQEIKRLQQYSAWLEENLKAAEMKSLNRQKMSAIKAVLDKGGLQNGATDVRRRNQNRMNRPRPISMIETVTKKIVRPATMRAKVAPAQVDARRRTMIISRPTLSQEEPTISATQRRLVYSQSLRERGINPRIPLSQLQRGTSTNSVSLSFRSPTPLIYTAFRNSKHTNSSSRVLGFDS